MHLVRGSGSLAGLELVKVPGAALDVSNLEAASEVLSLDLAHLAAHLVLLLLDGGSLLLLDRGFRAATEEHVGQPVADRGADSDGTCGSSHLGHHTGLLGLSTSLSAVLSRRGSMGRRVRGSVGTALLRGTAGTRRGGARGTSG